METCRRAQKTHKTAKIGIYRPLKGKLKDRIGLPYWDLTGLSLMLLITIRYWPKTSKAAESAPLPVGRAPLVANAVPRQVARRGRRAYQPCPRRAGPRPPPARPQPVATHPPASPAPALSSSVLSLLTPGWPPEAIGADFSMSSIRKEVLVLAQRSMASSAALYDRVLVCVHTRMLMSASLAPLHVSGLGGGHVDMHP